MTAIQQFTAHLTTCKNYSPATAREYEKDMHAFAAYAKEKNPAITWGDIDKAFIQAYEIMLIEKKYEPATICRRISAIASFYDFAKAIGVRKQKDNPARFVTRPKQPKKLPKAITNETIIATMNDKTVDIETRAFIALAFTTGMRISEIIDLERKDVKWDKREILVHGKGAKERLVWTTEQAMVLLETLKLNKGTIFANDDRTTRYNVYNALKKHAHDGDTQLSPHAIRHTFASNMIERGMPLKALATIMGHDTVKTTERYLNISEGWLKKEYQKANGN